RYVRHLRSPFYRVPARLDGSLNNSLIQVDKALDVVPRHGQQGTEGQVKEDDKRKILEHLLGHALLEQFLESVASLPGSKDLVPPDSHAVRRIVKLFQVTKIQRELNEIAQQRGAEVEETRPERLIGRIAFQKDPVHFFFQLPVKLVDEHFLVLEIA